MVNSWIKYYRILYMCVSPFDFWLCARWKYGPPLPPPPKNNNNNNNTKIIKDSVTPLVYMCVYIFLMYFSIFADGYILFSHSNSLWIAFHRECDSCYLNCPSFMQNIQCGHYVGNLTAHGFCYDYLVHISVPNRSQMILLGKLSVLLKYTKWAMRGIIDHKLFLVPASAPRLV